MHADCLNIICYVKELIMWRETLRAATWSRGDSRARTRTLVYYITVVYSICILADSCHCFNSKDQRMKMASHFLPLATWL